MVSSGTSTTACTWELTGSSHFAAAGPWRTIGHEGCQSLLFDVARQGTRITVLLLHWLCWRLPCKPRVETHGAASGASGRRGGKQKAAAGTKTRKGKRAPHAQQKKTNRVEWHVSATLGCLARNQSFNARTKQWHHLNPLPRHPQGAVREFAHKSAGSTASPD